MAAPTIRNTLRDLRILAASTRGQAWRDRAKAIVARQPAPHPYAKTTRNGHTIDQLTNYALYAMEVRLGYPLGSLTVVQGSYNGGSGAVAQSAGTHDGGGAVDLTPDNWQGKVRAGKNVGFAIWHRPFNWDNAGGSEHVHAELIGNEKASPSAKVQWALYRLGLNGLANRAKDANPWRPTPIPTFRMPKWAVEV